MQIEHITIHTADLNRSIAFYRDALELAVRRDLREVAGMPIVFLSDSEDGPCIELIESKQGTFSGDGISIGFHVPDVSAAHRQMEEAGLNPTPIISPNPHTHFFFILDPNGVKIQLI